jgi:hypothetical protein
MKKGNNSSLKGIIDARSNIHMGRYDIDGAPVRHDGPLPPIKEDENDVAFVDSRSWHFGLFNMQDPTHRQHGLTLQDVMDGCANQLFYLVERERITHKEEDGKLKLSMYVEWVEMYKELNPRFSNSLSSMGKADASNHIVS